MDLTELALGGRRKSYRKRRRRTSKKRKSGRRKTTRRRRSSTRRRQSSHRSKSTRRRRSGSTRTKGPYSVSGTYKAYDVKDKKMVTVKNPKLYVKYKGNRVTPMIQGTSSSSGIKVSRIMSKNDPAVKRYV